MAKKVKKNVPAKASKKTTAVANYDYGDDAGAGFENQTRDDIAMPFLIVLQSNSPVVADQTVEGARAGMLFNTVTEEVCTEQTFIPACTRHVFVEWVPRDKDGGYVGEHDINDPLVAKAKAESEDGYTLVLENGNVLVETFYVYGVLTEGTDSLGFVTMAFDSTKIKVYKKFNTRLQTYMVKVPGAGGQVRKVKPPMFAHHCMMTTTKETNTKGSWYNPVIAAADEDIASSLLKPEDPRYQAAAECRELVNSGIATPAYDTVNRDQATHSDDDDTPF